MIVTNLFLKKMKTYLTVISLLVTLTVFCQNSSCKDFKTGKFKYSNPKYAAWTISRTDSVQVEINSKTGTEITSQVEWKSDCNLKLTCKSVSKNNMKHAIGHVFEIYIYETFNDGYKCISKSNDIQLEDLELEMIKIK